MRKLMLPGVIGILLLALAACGAAAPAAAPTATPAPEAAAKPAETGKESEPAAKTQPASLEAYAKAHAGGPGAIYVGRLEDLAGPAPTEKLGDLDGMVSLESLQNHEWIFTSDYYQKLLDKANLDNPAPLVTQGANFKFQYACINRALLPCVLMESYFAPNIFERTQGQIEVQVVGYPELGIAGPDMIQLIADGTIGFGEITGAYVGGDLPILDLYYLWGLFDDREIDFKAVTAVLDELDVAIEEATGGGTVVLHNWYAGNDQYFFSRRPLRNPEDFEGLKTRSHGTTMSDLINGMGGEAQFVAFAEVYTALERGILDAGVTGGDAGYGQRWYEVTDYIVGPAISMPADLIIFNKDTWAKIPPDLQQIILEEGAKEELEHMRLAPPQNETALQKNLDEGMEYIPFSPEIYDYIFSNVVMQQMIPGWVRRVGGVNSGAVKLFNEKYAPIAGVQINADGSITKIAGHERWATPQTQSQK